MSPTLRRGLFLLLLSQAAVGQVRDRLTPPAPLAPVLTVASARVDTFIRVGADSLDATLFLPAGWSQVAPDSGVFPGMLFVHGFGGTKDWDTASARLWAEAGYVTLCYTVRGHGRSSGLSTIMGPAERADLAPVVEFLRHYPHVDSSRVGLQGGSQGGLHGLWALADRLHVEAVSADVITPHWASDMLSGGCIRHTVIWLLDEPTVRYDRIRDTLWQYLTEGRYADLSFLFPRGRDVDTATLHTASAPLVTFLKWQDHYFPAQRGMESFLRQQHQRMLYLGTGGHYSDEVLSELEFQWSLLGDWLNYFLRNVPNGVLSRPEITYAASSLPVDGSGNFTWTRYAGAAWPPEGTRTVRFYIGADLTLSPVPRVSSALPLVLANAWDGQYAFDDAYEDDFHGPRFEAALRRDSILFRSEPLAADLLWVGTPLAHWTVSTSFNEFPLHLRIYEEDGQETHLINRINYTARDWRANPRRSVDVEGVAHAHRFSRGNRLVFEITNIDRERRPHWGDAPFVVPLFAQASMEIFADSSHPSWVELPVVGDPAGPLALESFSGIYDATRELVHLAWGVERTAGDLGFSIERCLEGERVFRQVGAVPSASDGGEMRLEHYAWQDPRPPEGRHFYRVRHWLKNGEERRSDSIQVDAGGPVSAACERAPSAAVLVQNYPNPFNAMTSVSVTLQASGDVRLSVYDILGAELETVLEGRLDAGSYSAVWNAAGRASGVYYLRLAAGGASVARAMLLVR